MLVIVGSALILCLIRFLAGPSLPDRALALDTFSNLAIVFLGFLAFYFNRFIYLDIALVYAVLSFIGTIVFARFLEKGI